MQWTKPQYSKKQVRKAGIKLVKSDPTIHDQDFIKSARVFYNWRASHAFPMQIMLVFLRKNAQRIDRQSLVVQRLKRGSSIFYKLFREKGMSLDRMEDIAGCRAVLNKVEDVKRLHAILKISSTKNILHRERDYISKPKESGYRGIHLIYRYNGSKELYRGLYIELQLRSKIQHSWATAVEVVGAFTKQALKASSGDKTWLDFFKYASVEFSKLENCTIDDTYKDVDTLGKLKECDKILDISNRLRAFNVAVKTITERKSKKTRYYLLLLDLDKRLINLRGFDKNQLEEATRIYNEDEQKYAEDNSKDIVLVYAESLRDLKKAYPNYFLDTEYFSKYIEMVYKANQGK
jgi:hypothetical protein